MGYSWQELCVGREKQLITLLHAWHEAKQGNPGLVVLKGESGFGKTRLVQEFYSTISQETVEDKGNYWPDSLGKSGNTLKLNPLQEELLSNNEIPYLWWGVRWVNPVNRNQSEASSCALIDCFDHLSHHQENLSAREERLKRGAKAAYILTKIMTGGSVVGDVIEFTGEMIDGWTDWKREREANKKEAESSEEAEARIVSEKLNDLEGFFRNLLKNNESSPALPVILVLDDAQWIDKYTYDFLDRLLADAKKLEWPLLVVITHWEQEWNSLSLGEGVAVSSGVPQLFSKHEKMHPTVIDCEKVVDLDVVIDGALPGLLPRQVEFILGKADGNPLLLHEIILELLSDADYFVNSDVSQPLSEESLSVLKSHPYDLHSVQRRRFSKLNKNIQDVLVCASYAGFQFLSDFVVEIAAFVDDSVPTRESLREAIFPYAVLTKESAVIYEFKHQVYFDIAKEKLEKFPRKIPLIKEAIKEVGYLWYRGGRFNDLGRDQQVIFFQCVIHQCHLQDIKNEINNSDEIPQYVRLLICSIYEVYKLGATDLYARKIWFILLLNITNEIDAKHKIYDRNFDISLQDRELYFKAFSTMGGISFEAADFRSSMNAYEDALYFFSFDKDRAKSSLSDFFDVSLSVLSCCYYLEEYEKYKKIASDSIDIIDAVDRKYNESYELDLYKLRYLSRLSQLACTGEKIEDFYWQLGVVMDAINLAKNLSDTFSKNSGYSSQYLEVFFIMSRLCFFAVIIRERQERDLISLLNGSGISKEEFLKSKDYDDMVRLGASGFSDSFQRVAVRVDILDDLFDFKERYDLKWDVVDFLILDISGSIAAISSESKDFDTSIKYCGVSLSVVREMIERKGQGIYFLDLYKDNLLKRGLDCFHKSYYEKSIKDLLEYILIVDRIKEDFGRDEEDSEITNTVNKVIYILNKELNLDIYK
ncbi:AAA family ATPase [Oceanicoccus sagamiensis]|uniref:Orc1-like AAA ATPase domain-containing protein n=1 Tax=Oceanicoccus sagamiensis TaxID=716816 RepID=A0A1X9NF77_9GAMM|nr:ATP-binding protein [Oceanicoccus sagamiensis]ARN75092.1 hypothetical protein BST96_13800 [Oceanicoccus sagamiensis]